MKKLMSILLAITLAATLACGLALAESDEVPQTEAGKKFDNNWAVGGGIAQIYYEEVGYRVYIDIKGAENTGHVWEYSCYYHEDEDALVSVSSSKFGYTVDFMTGEMTANDYDYQDVDVDDNNTVFTVNEEGKLVWKDGRGNDGEGLQFVNIGRFDGRWTNEAEGVSAEFTWVGKDDPDRMYYDVYIHRDGGNGSFVEFLMHGFYNPETGKLECSGTATPFTLVDGSYVAGEEDGETYEAFFSMQDNGKLLFEAANGIELQYEEVYVNEDAIG